KVRETRVTKTVASPPIGEPLLVSPSTAARRNLFQQHGLVLRRYSPPQSHYAARRNRPKGRASAAPRPRARGARAARRRHAAEARGHQAAASPRRDAGGLGVSGVREAAQRFVHGRWRAAVSCVRRAFLSIARAAETQGGASRRAVKKTAPRRAELAGAGAAEAAALEPRVLWAPGCRACEARGYRCAGSRWYREGARAEKRQIAWPPIATSGTSKSYRRALPANPHVLLRSSMAAQVMRLRMRSSVGLATSSTTN